MIEAKSAAAERHQENLPVSPTEFVVDIILFDLVAVLTVVRLGLPGGLAGAPPVVT